MWPLVWPAYVVAVCLGTHAWYAKPNYAIVDRFMNVKDENGNLSKSKYGLVRHIIHSDGTVIVQNDSNAVGMFVFAIGF